MRKGVLNFIVLLILLVGSHSFVYAEIFAPFVSGLSVSVENNSVTLTWKPAPSEIEVYEIYRSKQAFNEENFSTASKIGSVSHDVSVYTDYPPTTDKYYYAVLGKKNDSKLYKLFIPYRNITMSPIAVESTDSLEAMATKISNLSAKSTDESIDLSFQSSKPSREVVIYRSTSVIESQQDVVEAQAIASITSGKQEYTDYPLGGIPYYYAIVDADLAKAGAFQFVAGKNSLIDPIELPVSSQFLSRRSSVESRITPLPYLFVNNSVFAEGNGQSLSSFNFAREPNQLTEETSKVWAKLEKTVSSSEKTTSAQPVILPIDKDSKGIGSTKQLSQIVNLHFPDNPSDRTAWQNVEKQLGSFFNVSHTDEVLTRAHFYMGQVYFFQGKYKQAFFEFVMAQDMLYSEVQPWFERIYPNLSL